MLSHELDDQAPAPEIPELISVPDIQGKHTLQSGLGDRFEKSAGQMLPQQHAVIRRVHRRLLPGRRDIDQRKRSTCRQKKPVSLRVIFYREDQFIRLGLDDFRYMSSRKRMLQLGADI